MTARALMLGRFTLLALLAACIASCGWHTARLKPADAHSVGVEIFGIDVLKDRVPLRDIEPEVHAALSRAVSDLVDLPLVQSDRADVVVRGRVLQYRRRGGIRNSENELLETGVRVQLEAVLVDRRTETELAKATSALWSGHVVGGPDEERKARERALESLCDRLVLELFGTACYEPRLPASAPADAAAGAGESLSVPPTEVR
ncbi:MAG: hypothetical protein EPO68_18435 [Planctomycetota bacterium]|nr:MAG: hypothetical protein EPO68_18435 [Planctomycetota bacterium]